MSDFRAIAGVTKTLVTFLNTATGVPVNADLAPSDTISDKTPLIHMYLYRVEPNPAFTNNDFIQTSPTSIQEPPVGLDLFYLLTPYGPDQIEIQKTLGDVIQAFHETPVIPPPFDPILTNVTEEIRVFPAPLTLEQMTDLCRCFGTRPYRLATTYEVSVVLIDSRNTRTVSRVQERHVEVGALR
jgi:hypothetical protein